jgi:type II secretory pathway component PulJ
MTPREARNGGFALVEAVAVLALSALVLLTLLIAAGLVTRNSAQAARRANDLEMLATGLAALQRDLEGAKPSRAGSADGPLLFRGEATSLGFVVGRDGAALGPGDSLVWITTERDDAGARLVRAAAALLPQADDFASAAWGRPSLLVSGPWLYRFSYAARASPAVWRANWAEPGSLPGSVRLEVIDRAGGVRILPPLVARLRAEGPPPCPEGEAFCASAAPAPAGE